MKKTIPTGNEMISLPDLDAETAGVGSVTFLSMGHKGMLRIAGGGDLPLISPFIEMNGRQLTLRELVWVREHGWIPALRAKAGTLDVTMTVLPPIGERGFALRLAVTASEGCSVSWGLRGCWGGSWHCVNEDKPLDGIARCYESGWNDSLIFDFRCGTPLFAFAPMTDLPCAATHEERDGQICYALTRGETLGAGQTRQLTFYWGFGFEEVAAATGAKEMLRRGWEWEYARTAAWLDARSARLSTPKLTELYNVNLFFCIFFSTGVTLDTEELVCVTSRSTRYYVSAAYWDRDTLLWAFPAILEADRTLAREMLRYVFGRQRRNIGVHSRFIDGTVLEPGFELDELVAPIIALEAYVKSTADRSILDEPDTQNAVALILRRLEDARHPAVPLYETFLQPTDDVIVYPYLTYDNVLVWKALSALAGLLPERYGHLSAKAEDVKTAIYDHCVFAGADERAYFAWSVDLNGAHNVYDEPPGSLQLLPFYGFCAPDDPVWVNTVGMIRSPDYEYSFAGRNIAEIGCAHAPYPWILSLCNSLLSGHDKQALKELENMEMDNGVACESVDADTGKCTTGAAFATCAGFLCHCLRTIHQEDKYER